MSSNVKYPAAVGTLQPAWWGVGNVRPGGWPEGVTAAMIDCGLDYRLTLEPIQVEVPPLSGRMIISPNRRAVVRHPSATIPTTAILDVVSDHYKLVQWDVKGAILDPLAKLWPVASIGMLGEGERTFIVLGVGVREIAHEPYREYIFVRDDCTGKGSIRFSRTDVCAICENTYLRAEAASWDISTIRHRGDPEAMLRLRAQVELAMEKQRRETLAQFEAMARHQLIETEIAAVLEAAFPDPKLKAEESQAAILATLAQGLDSHSSVGQQVSGLAEQAKAQFADLVQTSLEHRIGAAQVYNRYNDTRANPGTLYALEGALVEYVDHLMPSRGRTLATVYGPRSNSKRRAWAAGVKLL